MTNKLSLFSVLVFLYMNFAGCKRKYQNMQISKKMVS